MKHEWISGMLARIGLHIRSGFWFVPAALTLAAIALALVLVEVDQRTYSPLRETWPRMFAAQAEGSRAMLSAIASSMITVAGVVFSITIVALAQASTQYTSRVLRKFMRDRLNQVVLGVFVGVFTYCLVVLRTISSGDDGPFNPGLAVFTAMLLALVAIGLLIVFIHHIATSIQAGEIARSVMLETRDAIDRLFPERVGDAAGADATSQEVLDWQPVHALDTGYIQTVEPEALINFAVRHDLVVRMDVGVGEFVATGRSLAQVSARGPVDAAMREELNALYVIGAFRTTDQDPAFGFRQLVDIALKALSPGINDTTTAVTCLDYLSVLLQHVVERGAEPSRRMHEGRLRVIARNPDFADLAELAFGQVLENAEGNTVVLMRLLRMVAEVAQVGDDPARHALLATRTAVIDEVWRRSARSSHAHALLAEASEAAWRACAAAPAARAAPRGGDGSPGKA